MSVMKNTFMAIIASVIATVCVPCAWSQSKAQVESMEQAALKVLEGDYYVINFEHFISRKERYIPASDKGSPGREYIPSNPQPPSEQDIDRAIACYEEALKLQPTGTWTLPKKHNGIITSTMMGAQLSARPPAGGIQAKLENAKKIKQPWQEQQQLAAQERQRRQEQQLAHSRAQEQQAIQEKQQQEQQAREQEQAAYNRGEAAYKAKNYDQVIAEFTEVIRLNPNSAEAYNYRGMAYDNKRDYDRAIADYTEAIKLNPNFTSAYISRGNAYKNKNDYYSAIADYETSLKFDPNNSTVRTNLAAVQQAQTQQRQQEQQRQQQQEQERNTRRQNGVIVILVSTANLRATLTVENTTSQTKKVLIALSSSTTNIVLDRWGKTDWLRSQDSTTITNSPEYTLNPRERREVVVPIPSGRISIRDIVVY